MSRDLPLHHLFVDVGAPAWLGRHDQLAVLCCSTLVDGRAPIPAPPWARRIAVNIAKLPDLLSKST